MRSETWRGVSCPECSRRRPVGENRMERVPLLTNETVMMVVPMTVALRKYQGGRPLGEFLPVVDDLVVREFNDMSQ